jgi:hypothetical protein
MPRRPLDARLRHPLRHAIIVIMTPFLFLIALTYRFLHPGRADACRAVVRDLRLLMGFERSLNGNESLTSDDRISTAA